VVLDYLRLRYVSLKNFNNYEREEIASDFKFYEISEVLKSNQFYDLKWDSSKMKSGQYTKINNKTIKIHSNQCYNIFPTNIELENVNMLIEFEVNVQQTGNELLYVGLINEQFNIKSHCMCTNPKNAFFVQCNGSFHMNSVVTNDTDYAWKNEKVTISMRVNLFEKKN